MFRIIRKSKLERRRISTFDKHWTWNERSVSIQSCSFYLQFFGWRGSSNPAYNWKIFSWGRMTVQNQLILDFWWPDFCCSERVENPNFDKKKPISEKNIQFQEVFFRDFPVRFSNMTNHVRFFNFNKGWIESWFAFCQFREQPTRGSFSSHLRPDLRLQSL